MPSWNELLEQFAKQDSDEAKTAFLHDSMQRALADIALLRNGRQVIVYGSAFLQKPGVPPDRLMISHEDLNGLMSVVYGMDWARGLTLVLHTPGGSPNAAESIVSYLRSKFEAVEVVVPTLAMSAGTMLALSADRVVMGRQSQLGPIDPQMVMPGRTVSARAVVEQFERAKSEIADPDTGDVRNAHVWAPILQSLGPALLQEAQNALAYSERMVAGWLARYMLRDSPDPAAAGTAVASHFNDASTHKSHGRRIGRDEARELGVIVDDLEDDQALQEAVLTAYHLLTIMFEQTPATKLLWADTARTWLKNWLPASSPTKS